MGIGQARHDRAGPRRKRDAIIATPAKAGPDASCTFVEPVATVSRKGKQPARGVYGLDLGAEDSHRLIDE
jgi:hypothetical protein